MKTYGGVIDKSTDVNFITLDILCQMCDGFWTSSDKNITLPFLSASEDCKCTTPLTAKYMSTLQVVNCSLPASVAVICLFDILTVQNNRL
jgi:hypothetical protein